MKAKLALVTGVAVGYVLGTRAGREQYAKLKEQAQSLWQQPKVQEQVHRASDTVKETVKEQAPVVQARVTSAASSAAQTVVDKATALRKDDADEARDQAGAGI